MRARWWPGALALVFLSVGCFRSKAKAVGFEAPPRDGTEVTCPVSGERCLKTPDTEAAVFHERTYFFCCPDCRGRFVEDPARYADR